MNLEASTTMLIRRVADEIGEPQAADAFSVSIHKSEDSSPDALEVCRARHVSEGTGAEIRVLRLEDDGDAQTRTMIEKLVTSEVLQVVRLRRRLHAIVDHAARMGRDPSADRGWATGMHVVTKAILLHIGIDPAAATGVNPELSHVTADAYRTLCWRGVPGACGIILQGDRARAALEWTRHLQFDDMKGPPRVTCPGQRMPLSMLQAAKGRPLREVVSHPTFDLLGDDVVVTEAIETDLGAQFHLRDMVEFAELPPAAADMSWSMIGRFNPLLPE